MPSIESRLQALERQVPPPSSRPRVILLVGMQPGRMGPMPLRRVSILGTVLQRLDEEPEAAFRERIEAFVIGQGRPIALGFQVPDGATT